MQGRVLLPRESITLRPKHKIRLGASVFDSSRPTGMAARPKCEMSVGSWLMERGNAAVDAVVGKIAPTGGVLALGTFGSVVGWVLSAALVPVAALVVLTWLRSSATRIVPTGAAFTRKRQCIRRLRRATRTMWRERSARRCRPTLSRGDRLPPYSSQPMAGHSGRDSDLPHPCEVVRKSVEL
jgi:hypothetical protein